MATKEDELAAWEKLRKSFPGVYCNLELNYIQYQCSGQITINYLAYVRLLDSDNGVISNHLTDPMEAVNDLIKKVEDSQ